MNKFLDALDKFEITFTGGVAVAVLLVLAYITTVGVIVALEQVAYVIKFLFGRK